MLVAKKLPREYELEEKHSEKRTFPRRKQRTQKADSVKEKMIIVGCVFVALFMGLMLIGTQAAITDHTDKSIQLKAEISDLQNSNERLKLEIAQLKSLDRIEKIAQVELGMIQPGNNDIQYIAYDGQNKGSVETASAGMQTDGNGTVEVQNKEKMHPALYALNKMVSNYMFEVKNIQAAQF